MNKDKLGIMLSVGCMIHCILMPLVLPLIPLIGLTMEHGFVFHIIIAVVIGVVAYFAIKSGVKKHGKIAPVILGIVGTIFLFIGGVSELLLFDTFALVTTLFGSLSLITAHYKNHKYSCSCKHHV